MKITILLVLIGISAYLIVYILRKRRDSKLIREFLSSVNLREGIKNVQIEVMKKPAKWGGVQLNWPKLVGVEEDSPGEVLEVYKDKKLVTELSYLTQNRIKISSIYPQYIYNIALRSREYGKMIPYSEEEMTKRNEVLDYERYISRVGTIGDIRSLLDEDIINLCKLLFDSQDYDDKNNVILRGETVIGFELSVGSTLSKEAIKNFSDKCRRLGASVKVLVTNKRINKGSNNFCIRTGVIGVDCKGLLELIKEEREKIKEQSKITGKKRFELTQFDVEKYYPKGVSYGWDTELFKIR